MMELTGRKKRLLVVKLADIGDVLTATPALRALRRAYPRAHITALIPPHCREVLEGSPYVDGLLLFEKARFDALLGSLRPSSLASAFSLLRQLLGEPYDALVLLHHLTTAWGTAKYALLAAASGAPIRAGLDNGRGWFLTHRAGDEGFGARHEVEHCLEVAKLLGAQPDYSPLDFPLGPEDEERARFLLPDGDVPLVALHPGSGTFSIARRWPLDNFAQVAYTLGKEGLRLVLLGGPGEEALAEALAQRLEPPPINLAGRTSLRELGAVLKRCWVFVGNDSGVMHIAAAVGTPLVAIFGPSNPRAWGPWTGKSESSLGDPDAPAHSGYDPWELSQSEGSKAVVLRAYPPSVPCLYIGHHLGNPRGCPTRPCLTLIQPETVVQAVKRMLYNK